MDSAQESSDMNVPPQDVDNDDLLADETPAFLNPDDAVEVQVQDDAEPIDEDDEEEDTFDDGMQEEIPDMSRIQLSSHTGPVYAVATHLDANQKLSILSAGGDDKAFLHHVTTSSPESLPLAHAHTDSVSCAAFNMDYILPNDTATQRLAAVGAYDGAIVLYDADTGAALETLEGPTDVEWLHFHPKGGTVLLAGSAADGTVWMYHIPMHKVLQVFVGHESAVTDGRFSPDGKWALSCSADGTLRMWAPKTGVSKHVFRLGAGVGLTSMDTQEQLVLVGSEDGQAHVCHIGTKKVVASLRHYEHMPSSSDEEEEVPSSVEAVAFCKSNPNWCATGGANGVLKVHDLANHGQCRHVCRADGSEAGITRLHWHPRLPLVFCSYTNGALRVWDARNGQLLQTYTGSANVINDMSVQFSGTSAVLVSASDDGSVRVFDINMEHLLAPPSS
jgi:WD40 repeat protein